MNDFAVVGVYFGGDLVGFAVGDVSFRFQFQDSLVKQLRIELTYDH